MRNLTYADTGFKETPDEDGYYGWGTSDYQALIDSMEYEQLVDEHDDDYQGSSYYLLKDGGGRHGILIFGWGSCSGCDALQACSSHKEVVELRDSLHDGIVWFDTPADLKAYVESKDWETEWYWHERAGQAFAKRVKEFTQNA